MLAAVGLRPPGVSEVISGAIDPLHPVQQQQAPSSSASAPYHSKLVSRINLNALADLDADDQSIAQQFRKHRGWCDNPSFYEKVPVLGAGHCPETRLLQRDIDLSIEHGTIEQIEPAEVRGPLNVFTVFEPFKGPVGPDGKQVGRRRGIKEPKVLNAYLSDADIEPDMQITGKKQILQLVLKGTHFAQIDGAAFFDQFELADEISSRLCFKKRGRYYRQKSLTMGGRTSVQVAQSAMRQLANVPGGRTARGVCIDNCILVGDESSVRHDLLAVRDRAAIARVTLNEAETLEKEPDALIVQRGEYGGIFIDLETKETALTEKIVAKVKMSYANRHRWSVKGFAAHVGLLFWAIGVIDIPIASFFALLQFISRTSQLMTKFANDPSAWNRPIAVWETAMRDVDEWTALCVANKKKKVVRPPEDSEATWLMATDACRWGWGFVAVNQETNEVRHHGERWRWAFWQKHGHKLHRSTFTEPWGVYFSCCHLLSHTGKKQHVIIGTDNTVTEAALNRGYNAHSFDINACIQSLRAMYPPDFYTFKCRYIPGDVNKYLADPLSRTGVTSEEEGQIARRLRRELGGVTHDVDATDRPPAAAGAGATDQRAEPVGPQPADADTVAAV